MKKILFLFLLFSLSSKLKSQDTTINFTILYNKEVVNYSSVSKLFFLNLKDSSKVSADYTFGRIKVNSKAFELLLKEENKHIQLEFNLWTKGNIIESFKYPLDIIPIRNIYNYSTLISISKMKSVYKGKYFFKTDIYSSTGSFTFISPGVSKIQ